MSVAAVDSADRIIFGIYDGSVQGYFDGLFDCLNGVKLWVHFYMNHLNKHLEL